MRFIGERFYCISVRILHAYAKMWCHALSTIDQSTHGRCHLNRCHLKGLTETHGRKLHLTNIFFLMHNRCCFPRKIYSRLPKKPELFKIITESSCSQSQSNVNKYRITGILYPLYKCFSSMSPYFVTPDFPVFHDPVARTGKCI